jgi:hypothetical protein
MRIKSRAFKIYEISVPSVPCKLSSINGLGLYIPYTSHTLGHLWGGGSRVTHCDLLARGTT